MKWSLRKTQVRMCTIFNNRRPRRMESDIRRPQEADDIGLAGRTIAPTETFLTRLDYGHRTSVGPHPLIEWTCRDKENRRRADVRG